MLAQVNGMPVLAQGANLIPFEQFEGRLSAKGTRNLVQSLKAAHFTMVRPTPALNINPPVSCGS